MFKVKLDQNEIKEYLRKRMEEKIDINIDRKMEYNLFWKNEKIEEFLDNYLLEIVKEILKEDREKLKDEVRKAIIRETKDIAFEALADLSDD